MPAHLISSFLLLGILLAVVGLLLCITYRFRPHRFIPLAATAAILLSLLLAHFHSSRHVSRLQVDRPPVESEEDAFSYAKLLEARGEDVAAVRFAEDTQSDVIDRAGLDEADLAYFDSIAEKQPVKPVEETTSLEEAVESQDTILVDEATFALATHLNRWNLTLTKSLLALAALLIGYDYLRRFNHYATATFPLPLPSALPNAVTPHPTITTRPDPPRRTLPEEAAWLAQRGDSFLLLTANPESAAEAARLLTQAPKWRRPKSLIHITREAPDEVTDDFIFESLWYHRASFIIDDPARAQSITAALVKNLTTRNTTRARLRQTAHLIWDLKTPIPDPLPHLAQDTGLAILK